MSSAIYKLLPFLLLAGCTETLQQVNRDLSSINRGMANAAGAPRAARPAGSAPGVVPISARQLEQIDAALRAKDQNQAIAQAITEAAPVIRDFVKIHGCLNGYNGTFLNPYFVPGKSEAAFNYIGAPMQQMRYHDKSSCVTVLRFGGWTMPARNALQFEVVYQAEDSGETVKSHHELRKQPGNEWLFSR
ncbi:hypothetical protein [Noviherbaspirillum malthae]|uniref:hypothetical protein n=1 Tax=Noviherbaspirillum malthae TaxID=1260987 RepID=UPI00188FD88A|nr:hypothetical protein [Noviherbaspirillum malthae]